MSSPADAAPASSGGEQFELDPVFLHSRREAIAIFSLWFFCLLWSVPVCYAMGYGQEIVPREVPTVLGMPSWIFWGLVLPWLVADAATIWLCFGFIKNDPLGEVAGEETADAKTADGEGSE
jgi:hypothetical protein